MSAFQKFEYSNEPFQAQTITGSQISMSQSSIKRENVVVNLVDDEEEQTYQPLAKKPIIASSSTLPKKSTKRPTASNSTENLAPNPTSEISLSTANANEAAKPLEELQLFPAPSKSSTTVLKAKTTNTATTKTTTTKKASTSATAVTAKAKAGIKGRILKELEKLNPQDRMELLNELTADSVGAINKLDAQGDRDVVDEGDKSPLTKDLSVDETELMKMRLELGEILNRESDLRAKEKKLRTSIKKLQRKVSLAYEIPYEIQEDSLEQILARLFQLSEPHPWEIAEETVKPKSDLHLSCPLWFLAQQHEESVTLVEDKRLDVERDATIQSPASQPSQTKFISSMTTGQIAPSPVKKDGPSILSQMIAAIDSSEPLTSSSQVHMEVEKADCSSPKLLSLLDNWVSLVSKQHESSLQSLSNVEDILTCSRRESEIQATNELESQGIFQQLSTVYLDWKQTLLLKEDEKNVAKIIWMDLMDQMIVNAKICMIEDKVDKFYCFGILILLQRMLRDVADMEHNHNSTENPIIQHEHQQQQSMVEHDETFDIYDNVAILEEDNLSPCQNEIAGHSTSSQIHDNTDNYHDLVSSGDHAPMIGVKRVFSNTIYEPICLLDDHEDSPINKEDDIIVLEAAPKKQKMPTSPSSSIPSSSSQLRNSQSDRFDYSQAQSMSLFERLTQMREKHKYEKAHSSLPKDPLTSPVEPDWHMYTDQQIISIADQYGLVVSSDTTDNLRKLLKSMWKSMNQDVVSAGSSSSNSSSTQHHILDNNNSDRKDPTTDTTMTTVNNQQPANTQTKPISKAKTITSSQNNKTLKRTELTKSLFKDFLKRHLDIYQDILMYIPVCLDVVHARLLQDNIKVHKKELLAFLDQEAIFVAMRKQAKSASSSKQREENNQKQDDDQRMNTENEEENDDDDGDMLSQEEETYE